MEKMIFNRLATLVACGFGFASAGTGYAQPAVTYLDWDVAKGEMVQRTVTDYEVVTSATRTFENGKWYVVADQITIDDGTNIKVAAKGAAHLVLCDGASLTITKVPTGAAIRVVSEESLTIYGQQNGTGVLTAIGGAEGAGIGSGSGGKGGTVTINGGVVTAKGGTEGAGIGGSRYGQGGTVTINGGRVTAVGNGGGKGIGGGSGAGQGSVRINGGTVSTEGWNGMNLVTIDGGNVKAVSPMGYPPISPQPKNRRGLDVYCVNVELGNPGSETVTVEGLKDYVARDVYPLDGNRLYLYLPTGDYDFVVNGTWYRAVVRKVGVQAQPIVPQPTDVLPFDGVLTQDGRPLGSTNATALVRVNGAAYEVAIRTDADGRFAASLPRQATPTSEVAFVNAKVGARTIAINRPLTVPQLPYAFGADYAERVVADGDFTVVDSEVTVLGDLMVAEDVKCGSDTVVGGVNGNITVGQPLSAKYTELEEITAGNDAMRIFGIGDPIEVLDANLEGAVTKELVSGDWYVQMLYACLAPRTSSPKSFNGYRIDRSENFVFGALSPASSAHNPEKLYAIFPESDTSQFLAYTAEADGFLTIEIVSRPSYGGIALTVDFKGAEANAPWHHSFEQCWHRSAWNPQLLNPAYLTDDKKESERPAFNREYVFAMGRGETVHARMLLQACYDKTNALQYQLQCPCDIDLHVKVTFRPIGFAE